MVDAHFAEPRRSLAELEESLAAAGFAVDDVRDAPDRPGREFVVLARRTG